MMQVLSVSSASDYATVVAQHEQVLAEFSQSSCTSGPCVEEALRAINQERSLADFTLLKVRMDLLGSAFFKKLGVIEIPTLVLISRGVEVARHTGFYNPDTIASRIEQAFWGGKSRPAIATSFG